MQDVQAAIWTVTEVEKTADKKHPLWETGVRPQMQSNIGVHRFPLRSQIVTSKNYTLLPLNEIEII